MTRELLEMIDNVVDRLREKGSLKGSDIKPSENAAYDKLHSAGWIVPSGGKKGLTNNTYFHIRKSDNFDSLLSLGAFSEQQVNSETSNNRININATNSNVIIGDNNYQSLDLKLFDDAIKQIYEVEDLSSEDKDELICIVEDIKSAKENKCNVGKSTLSKLGKWGEKILDIGGSLASIYDVFSNII